MKKLLSILLVLLVLVGCGSGKDQTDDLEKIVIGGTALPHADFLKQLKAPLKALGYDLEVIEFDDYVAPTASLESGELDANYFQHIPYFEGQIADFGYDFANAGGIHIEWENGSSLAAIHGFDRIKKCE